jgi:squalene-hopene/tetraprenyl-beta-curcumene cyclase
MDKILNAVGAARAARIDLLIVFAMGLAPGWHAAAEAAQQQVGPDPAKLAAVVGPAMAFLDKAQADDGSFSKDEGLGVTALVATAMLRQGRSTSDPTVARALKYLEALVNDDGGVYSQDSLHKNYETSVAIVCFNEANHDGRYDEQLRNAERFVKSLQWDESEGFDKSSDNYGGAGYGSHSRPDLSNTSFLIDALHAVGRDADDPALQKALVFVSRCQNLATSENATAYADKVNDGGFYYTIAAGGSSQAGETPDGGLRSYGSMTYAGLKSMIYAGVGPDDPRVKAALLWIEDHYALAENPGMGTTGLYYYYHTFAKALDATGEDLVTDAGGTKHDWRRELFDQLRSTQLENGSWVNSSTRWLEGNPNLVTAYALLSLSYCTPQPAAGP